MKKISFILLSLGLFSSVFTQEATTPKGPWEKGIISTATFSQTTLSNWAAGGQNAISMNLYGKLFANYKKDKNSWENSLELAYGLLRQDKSAPVKSDDKIDFITKYSRQLNNDKLFFSTFINFRSQLANGFAYPEAGGTDLISQFAAPAYLFITVGLEYKPVDYFSVYFSPLTNKNTWVTEHENINETSYGLDAGKTWRFEGGSYLKLHFKKELFKNVNVESKADFFANYAENFGNIDVNWETAIVMQINKYLSTNLFTHLIYDDDISIADENNPLEVGPKVQYKQVFGLGLTYQISNKK